MSITMPCTHFCANVKSAFYDFIYVIKNTRHSCRDDVIVGKAHSVQILINVSRKIPQFLHFPIHVIIAFPAYICVWTAAFFLNSSEVKSVCDRHKQSRKTNNKS